MTLVITLAGESVYANSRYTLWNVTQVHLQPDKVVAEHSDRPYTEIPGQVIKIERKDTQ